jgi:hypothetical protein
VPAPSTKYRCENDKCIEAPTGVDLQLCKAACEPNTLFSTDLGREGEVGGHTARVDVEKSGTLLVNEAQLQAHVLAGGNFSIVPQSNCTASLKLCYQGPLAAAQLNMKTDPLNFCNNQHAAKLLVRNFVFGCGLCCFLCSSGIGHL